MQRLSRLAGWASSVRPHDVPEDVRLRAALLHLSAAGVIRSTMLPSPAQVGDGLSRLRAEAAALAAREYDDLGWFGHPAGAVLGARAAASAEPLDLWLTATAVGAEVVARLGTWAQLQDEPASARTWLASAGVAAAVAVLRGYDAETTGNAIAIALARPRQLTGAETRSLPSRTERLVEACETGWHAAEQAARGELGDSAILDYPDGPPGVPVWAPLGAAFDHLGQAWLSRAIVYRLEPAAAWAQTAVQGFAEILRRHQKAASKRLRVDQVERIEVRIDHLAWMRSRPAPPADVLPDAGQLPFSIPHLLGALIASHESGPALYDPVLLQASQADILSIASKVEVVPDAGLTVQRLRGAQRALGPLLDEVPRRKRLSMARSLLAARWPELPRPTVDDVRHAIAADVLDLVDVLLEKRSAGRLPDQGLHVPQPVSLRLYTTRGGWWPERRDVIEGGPEYGVADLEKDVVAKYARCCAWLGGKLAVDVDARARDRARAVLATAQGDKDARPFTARDVVMLLAEG